ncbi:hypothetical protein, partial [Mesorhizobium sp. M3A.F.Ca.ET.174.01.1.1]|uniref:hypothetical protein n=1 Tax=Mesorhizobium sp. M3A.F.Ca.ET.174.01.1.1 TaxID=2563944 RepID=UPI001AEE9C31
LPISPDVSASFLQASFLRGSGHLCWPGCSTQTKENVMRKIILAAAVLSALTGTASAVSIGSGYGNGNGNVGAFNGNFNGRGNR